MEPTSRRPAARRPWTAPRIETMPPLKDLTLQTGFVPVDTEDSGTFSY